ncbi:MAG: hypothetical protein STHCBS139747_000267 [Sporothrix thermara]
MSSSPPPQWDYIAKLVCIGDSGCGKSSLTIRLCEGRFVTHHDVTIGVEFGSRIVPVGPPHSRAYLPSAQPQAQAQASSSTTATTATAAAGAAATSKAAPTSSPSATTPGTSTPTSASATTSADGGLPDPPRAKPSEPQKHMKLSLWDTAGQETYKSVTRSYFRGASGALLVFDLSRKNTFLHVKDWLDDLRQIADPDIVVVLVGNKADLASPDNTEGGEGNQRQVTRDEAEEWARRNGVLEYVETSAKSGENVEHAFLRVADRIYQNIQAGRYDLNDRRSGVKGPGAAAAAAASAGRGRPLRLDKSAYGKQSGCC